MSLLALFHTRVITAGAGVQAHGDRSSPLYLSEHPAAISPIAIIKVTENNFFIFFIALPFNLI
ncbi:hypothetical protein [Wolinella succinogenes]|uniref:hypothetical protein n=1 Tax=Wolinella succinogenes TaxID=844 RepID=UPI0013EC7B31|nr:hypothetical protein [Wolinella succinogenes]